MEPNNSNRDYIRVFISSTFKDMNAERDYLTDKIFPRIQHEAVSRGIDIKFIDLRWGVTEEEAKQGRVIETCLREIDECRPFFIGLLGERYGWSPQREDLGAFKYQLYSRYKWLENDVENGLSITEMEMQYAALRNNGIEHAYFYIRSPKMSTPAEYRETGGSKAAEKLDALKVKIESQDKYPVATYNSLDELGQMVYEALDKLVKENSSNAANSVQEEHERHEAVLRMRTANYVSSTEFFEFANKWLSSSGKVLLINGEAYMGKSTHMSNYLAAYRKSNPSFKTVYHNVGSRPKFCTNTSFDVMLDHVTSDIGLLYGWRQSDSMEAVGCIFGLFKMIFSLVFKSIIISFKQAFSSRSQEDLASDLVTAVQSKTSELVHRDYKKFRKYMKKVEKKGDLIMIFLDNLDKLSDEDEKSLGYFINDFPKNVRFVVSARSGSVAESVIRRETNAVQYTVSGFDYRMAYSFAVNYLKSYSKGLSAHQLLTLLKGFYINNPYLFSKVLEQLVSFGSFEDLDKKIEEYSNLKDKQSLCDMLIKGLVDEFEGVFSKNPLSSSIFALALSNRGLTEEEIENVLELKPMEWSAVRGHVLALCMRNDEKYLIEDADVKNAVFENVPSKVQEEVIRQSVGYFRGLIDYATRTNHLNAIGTYDTGKVMEDTIKNKRQAEELPALYLYKGDYEQLYRYVLYVHNNCYFSTSERLRYWKALYEHGYNMLQSDAGVVIRNQWVTAFRRFSPNLVPIKKDFREYYTELGKTANMLNKPEDAKWARENIYKYQDEDVKKNIDKSEYDALTKIEGLMTKGRFQEAIEFGRTFKSSDFWITYKMNIFLIVSYRGVGDMSSAFKLCQQTVNDTKTHPMGDMEMLSEATSLYANLCSAYGNDKMVEEGLTMLSEIKDYQMKVGLDNNITFLMLNTYGKLYFRKKEYQKAHEYYTDAYRSSQMVHGQESYNSYISLGMLGTAQRMCGMSVEADKSLKTAIYAIVKRNPKDQVLYDMLLHRYMLLCGFQRYKEALDMISHAKTIYESYPGKNAKELEWLQQKIDETRSKISG